MKKDPKKIGMAPQGPPELAVSYARHLSATPTPDEYLSRYGALVKAARKARWKSSNWLAAKLGCSGRYLRLVETGERAPLSSERTRMIAKLFNVDEAELHAASTYYRGGYMDMAGLPQEGLVAVAREVIRLREAAWRTQAP